MNNNQGSGCTIGFSFGILVIMALIGFLAIAAAATPSGGGNNNNTTTNAEVHIFSDNVTQILSPQTNINSGNASTSVNGDHNDVITQDGTRLCWDETLKTTTSSACGAQ